MLRPRPRKPTELIPREGSTDQRHVTFLSIFISSQVFMLPPKAQAIPDRHGGKKAKPSSPTSPHHCGLAQTLFFGAPKSLQMVTVAMKLKDTQRRGTSP